MQIKGGEAIAAGGFGCVFRPPLKCSSKNSSHYSSLKKSKMVSKLMIKKYGEEDGKGNLQVMPFLDEAKTIQNPKFASFANEYNTLLAEEKEIEFPSVTLDDLKDVKGEGFYGVFLKHITVDSEVVEVVE